MGFNIVAISRSEDKKDLAMKLGAKHYFSIDKGDFAKEIQNLGGAKAVLLAGPSENIADKLIESIQEGGKLMLLGTNNVKMEFSINPIIFGKKSIQGWVCFDNEVKKECLEFSLKNDVKPMIKIYKFEELQKGYDDMCSGHARFRSVIQFN
jgi:D-arabinose 1-dehydrogenase-like Zn-dependent alcohol dehydrogenase